MRRVYDTGCVGVPTSATSRARLAKIAGHVRSDIVNGRDQTIVLVDVQQTARCVALYAAGFERASFEAFVKRFEASRSDEQGGSSGTDTGSTSIVSRGPAARVLSLAAEHGALTQSVADQRVTVRGNLAGVPAALHVFTSTGDIWLAQAKLSLVPPNRSVKIPLAITYSNRTELVDKPAWSAQIGLTYDFDSLFAGLTSRR